MHCVKCGREVVEDNVFCNTCLAEMEKNPVTPGTVVLLPTPEKKPARKTSFKKHILSPEEQLSRLKKRIKRLRILVAVLLLAAGILAYVTSQVISELDLQRLLGQNYSTIGDSTHPTEE